MAKTLDEAKTMLVSYHAQRNLAMTTSLVVSARPEKTNYKCGSKNGDTELSKGDATEVH
jgi:hypothetical protein